MPSRFDIVNAGRQERRMTLKVLSFGELLWDMIGGKAYIGGAPFNLASHLAKIGIQSAYISSVGKDKLGEEAIKKAKEYGLNTRYISIHPYLPTGTVEVHLNQQGHPRYTIHENTAWDQITLEAQLRNILFQEDWDAFCFGTLAQRSGSNRHLLDDLIRHLKCQHFFYDVNLRQNFYQKEWIERSLNISTILKLNEEEITTISELLLGKVLNSKDFCQAIFSQYGLKMICVTLGELGSMIYNGHHYFKIPGEKVKVVDTVGAGDSYSAAFLFSFLSGVNARESASLANQVGAFVASQSGAVPDYSPELKAKIEVFRNLRKSV